MKWFLIQKSHSVAVSLILLIQLTFPVWSFECPSIISDECYCKSGPEFFFACSKNNEHIQIELNVFGSCSLKIRCTNITDGKIFKLFKFSKSELNFESIEYLRVESCPLSVLSSIEDSVSNNNLETFSENHVFDNLHNLKALEIVDSKLPTLTEHFFNRITNLNVLYLEKNGLTSLPENIFNSHTKLMALSILNNNLTTLSENLLTNLTDLEWFELDGNELITLPQKIFKNLDKLKRLSLAGNKLTTLPANIFKNQNELFNLDISKNNLKTLPENSFNHKLDNIRLEDNPWVCDAVFPEIVRVHAANHKDITCHGQRPTPLEGTFTVAEQMALLVKTLRIVAKAMESVTCIKIRMRNFRLKLFNVNVQ